MLERIFYAFRMPSFLCFGCSKVSLSGLSMWTLSITQFLLSNSSSRHD